MASITTALATSWKQEVMQAGHCFNATVTPTGTMASASANVTAVSSMSGVAVGMAVTGTSIPANTVVARVTGAATMTLSNAATAIITGGTLTITGDTFSVALVASTYTGTYSSANVNYSDLGSDELTTAGGYTQPGQALTNVTPTNSSGVAYTTFASNPSWSSATFSTVGCMIYNSGAVRLGGTSGTNTSGAGRCVGVYTFSGVQSVSSGVFSIVLPAATNSTAVIRIA